MFKTGWGPVPIVLLLLCAALATTAFAFARERIIADSGALDAPGLPNAETYDSYAVNLMRGISALPREERKERGRLVFEALTAEVRIAPSNATAWRRLAQAAIYYSDTPSALVGPFLEQSYEVGPIMMNEAPLRVSLALLYWDDVSPSVKKAAAVEAGAICRTLKGRACINLRQTVKLLDDVEADARLQTFIANTPDSAG